MHGYSTRGCIFVLGIGLGVVFPVLATPSTALSHLAEPAAPPQESIIVNDFCKGGREVRRFLVFFSGHQGSSALLDSISALPEGAKRHAVAMYRGGAA
jgi:hypothetical protein